MISIETKNLCKNFGEVQAVKDLNLKINEGELYSLLGVNGAGKSTTIKVLCCLIKHSSGDAYILNKSISKDEEEIKSMINVSPQETAVAENLTVRENLKLIAEIYNIVGEKAQQKIKEMQEIFELTSVLNKRAKLLSGGMKRRLSIAMALITEPKILFLDEPTLGLDVLSRRSLWKTIKSLKGKMTIMLTTHYMEEAEELSDRVGIMVDGKLISEGTPKELMAKTKTKNLENAFIKLASKEEK